MSHHRDRLLYSLSLISTAMAYPILSFGVQHLPRTIKISTISAVRSHTCSKVGTDHDRPHTTNNCRYYSGKAMRYQRFLNGPVTARTLLGLLPLVSFSPTVTMGSKVFQRQSGYAPEIKELYDGNRAYIANMSGANPGLLQALAMNGQTPPFTVLDCSDSRVNEQGIFSAKPGTLFTASNIANQYDEDDLNSNAVLSYAVESLKVKHVIVMGHYGCGGVASSMLPPPASSAFSPVQDWIMPIRQIYETSERPEIVAYRTKHADATASHDTPDIREPGFRALVEENVKASVNRIAKSAVMQNHYTLVARATITQNISEPITEVYIHGWVYDIENGQVSDLGVSVAPPGKTNPPTPFPITP